MVQTKNSKVSIVDFDNKLIVRRDLGDGYYEQLSADESGVTFIVYDLSGYKSVMLGDFDSANFVKTPVLPIFQSNVENYHHSINYIENNEVHFSVGVTISTKLSDYDTILTIPNGYRGNRTKGLIAVKQDSTNPFSYPLYYNSSDGNVTCLYGLPAGRYFIIG